MSIPKEYDQFYLSIQEVSQLFDVSKPTLRYYEDAGLLHSQRAPESNYRKYSLLSVVELSDIILYRNLDLPVKEIRELMQLPVASTSAALDQVTEKTEQEIQRMQHTLKEIKQRKLRITEYLRKRDEPMHLVENIPIRQVRNWNVEIASIKAYINAPYTSSYIIYIPDMRHPEIVREGFTDDTAVGEGILWTAPDDHRSYMECMIRTEYAYLDVIGIDNLITEIHSQGYRPVSLLGKYLLSDIDPTDGEKYDYFRAWIELK